MLYIVYIVYIQYIQYTRYIVVRCLWYVDARNTQYDWSSSAGPFARMPCAHAVPHL